MLERLIRLWQANPLLVAIAAAAAVVVVLAVVVLVVRRLVRSLAAAVARRRGENGSASGAPLFYVVACMSTGVSVNTSWRFFGERLHITDVPERVVMFAVLEAAFVACAYGMRANVRQPGGQPGAPRAVAWGLTVLSAYMAIAESDFWEGIARVALGPVLGIVALHLALGVEIRHASPQASTGWAQLVREMRERVLSRFGLANDDRDAATRTRHRAAVRAARLAAGKASRFRQQRLAHAVRAAGVAYDQDARERMLAELAALKSLDALTNLTPPSPWGPIGTSIDAVEASGERHETPAVPPEGSAHDDDGRPSIQPSIRPRRWTSKRLPIRTSNWTRGRVANAGRLRVQGRPVPSSRVVRGDARPPVQDVPAGGATPLRDRARATAREHAERLGQLPTVDELAALANVSRGTAGNALKELREQPGQLHLVHDIESASTQS
jgi:hypothetical protein